MKCEPSKPLAWKPSAFWPGEDVSFCPRSFGFELFSGRVPLLFHRVALPPMPLVVQFSLCLAVPAPRLPADDRLAALAIALRLFGSHGASRF